MFTSFRVRVEASILVFDCETFFGSKFGVAYAGVYFWWIRLDKGGLGNSPEASIIVFESKSDV